MNWYNKTGSTDGVSGLDSMLPDYVPYSNRSEYFMPEQYFTTRKTILFLKFHYL